MITPKISIIVPVWNAEKDLDRCIKSILSQDLLDWELLLVDDGSTDKSLSICDTYCNSDSRIHLISQNHSGVSAARNTALERANGEYISFIDSDDYIEPNYLSSLYKYHENDLVVCGYSVDHFFADYQFKNKEIHIQDEKSYNTNEKIKFKELFISGIMHMNWNKLWKKSIIDKYKLRYKPYPVNEDYIFLLQYIQHIQTIFIIGKPLYHWVRIDRRQSGVETIPPNMVSIYNEAHLLTRKFFKENSIADDILYYSYELIAIKYIKAEKENKISTYTCNSRLSELISNTLVKESFKIHKTSSKGEWLMKNLLEHKIFTLYKLIIK